MRPRRLVAPTVTLALVVPALTSCALLGGGGHLEDALDALPAGADRVEFVDRAALAGRLDLEDADVADYLDAIAEDAVGGTDLVEYLYPMSEGAAFDERDVEWAVTALVDDGLVSVYRVDDDVDLGELADDLGEAGLAEDEVRDRRRFRGDLDGPTIGDAYPPDFRETIIDEDEHLVVVGSGEQVLETLDEDRDSLGDADTFDDLLDGTDDVGFALLEADPRCGQANLPPEALERAGVRELRAPEARAFVISGDDAEQSAALQFADDDTAEEDAGARGTYLADGLLLRSAQPVSTLLTADVERDGDVVRVALDLDEPTLGRRLSEEGDAFLACSGED